MENKSVTPEIIVEYTLYTPDPIEKYNVQTKRYFSGRIKELIPYLKEQPINHITILHSRVRGEDLVKLGRVIQDGEKRGEPYSNNMY